MTAPTVPPPAPPEPQPLPPTDTSQVTGRAVITVRRQDGTVRSRQEVANIITDSGDQYHARCVAAGVQPVDLADVTRVSGMKLGTGNLAPSKNGAGAVLGAYVTGSAKLFDAGYPTVESLGAGLGWTVTYQCTFGPNVGTSAALTEVVMVTDAAANATTPASDTIARLIFAATPKGATDTMTLEWLHKFQGVSA